MKLRQQQNENLIPPLISKHEVVHPSETSRHDIYEHYEHPWYKFNSAEQLKKPNPPTKEAVDRAKFKDKTYTWTPQKRIT